MPSPYCVWNLNAEGDVQATIVRSAVLLDEGFTPRHLSPLLMKPPLMVQPGLPPQAITTTLDPMVLMQAPIPSQLSLPPLSAHLKEQGGNFEESQESHFVHSFNPKGVTLPLFKGSLGPMHSPVYMLVPAMYGLAGVGMAAASATRANMMQAWTFMYSLLAFILR